MTDIAVYEPMIVTTLRRYLRRRVPESLLLRLAGGEANWRYLNTAWNIDGRSVAPPRADRAGHEAYAFVGFRFGTHERRVALVQMAVECIDLGEVFPTAEQLAGHFDVKVSCINNDISELRADGRISVSLAGSVQGPRRVVRVAGVQGATAAPRYADA